MALGVLLKSGGMATVYSTLFVTFPLVQILWDSSFPCTVESGKMSCWMHMEELFSWNTAYSFLLEQPCLCGGAVGGIELEESFCQWNQPAGPFKNNIGSFWIALWLLLAPQISNVGPHFLPSPAVLDMYPGGRKMGNCW